MQFLLHFIHFYKNNAISLYLGINNQLEPFKTQLLFGKVCNLLRSSSRGAWTA